VRDRKELLTCGSAQADRRRVPPEIVALSAQLGPSNELISPTSNTAAVKPATVKAVAEALYPILSPLTVR